MSWRPLVDGGPALDLSALTSEQVDALLHELAARVASAIPPPVPGPAPAAVPRLVDAATLAEQLGVSVNYVYDHAEDLGVIRLPGRVARFDIARVLERHHPAGAAPAPRPRRKAPAGVPLLEIKGRRP